MNVLRNTTEAVRGWVRGPARWAVALLAGLSMLAAGGTGASAATPGAPAAAPGVRAPADAMAQAAAMQPGWNLGNSLDATGSDETSWGNPRVTRELLGNVRDQGFNSIRIPVTWSGHQGPAPGYTLDADYLDRVEEVAGWALDEGFHVMINIHHDSWQWIADMPADRAGVLARYNALWTQLADTFRDSSRRLVFESVNEPQFSGGSGGDAENAELLDELNTSFHRIVRGSGGGNETRLLVLPTLHTSADQARLDELAATIDALDDPGLAATVHYYGYWPFSVNVAGGTRFDATAQQDLTDAFDRVHSTFVARGIPVILGEYGLLGFDRHTGTIQQGEKLKFFEYLGHRAREKNITTMLWDNGQHFQRTGFQWNDPELYGQIRSSWTTRSGTASSDQVFSARSAAVTDKTLTLNPNGTAFTGLYHGTTELARGTDYTVEGDRLTLKATALARLSGGRDYGTNAELSARFSQGVPWRIDLITHDTPVLRNATGTTDSFAVPTDFRGDQLATMEARYADGSNAGPHNWTSYKEFDRAFAPDYGAGETVLTSEFFAEVADGARVTLTFHYWSGATVTYYVTRSGTTVTGTTA
ncbi:cellulase family glycosylhydrolase [Streptomyces albus]|uniref:cellulase family glycosylhydrolase n=1 Tax=Streptomyces albus TaxID=1888 RepID=UPI0006909001|nr:cellulase family glycosylhydrolase [Streptomyces albus]